MNFSPPLSVAVAVAVSVGHLVAVVWYGNRVGYHLVPSRERATPALLAWAYTGLVATAFAAVLPFLVFGLVFPVVVFALNFAATVRAEGTATPEEPLGVVYIGLWPVSVAVYLLSAAVEYGLARFLL